MIINGGFLYCWKVLPTWYRKKFKALDRSSNCLLFAVALTSFLYWLVSSTIMVLTIAHFSPPLSEKELMGLDGTVSILYCLTSPTQSPPFWIAISGWIIHLVLGLAVNYNSTPTPKSSSKQSWKNNILRGLAAFVAIFGAVLLSSIDPVVGGVVSTFPAIFGTAMVSVWLVSGPQVSGGAIGPLFLGSMSVPTMCILSAFWIPYLDTKVGTSAALAIGMISLYVLCVLFVSFPTYKYIGWRIRVTATISIDAKPNSR